MTWTLTRWSARRCVPALLALVALGCRADPAVLRHAQEWMERGQPLQAYEWLEAHEARLAGDLEFDLALAAAANRSGRFPRAILALERVLAREPGHRQARAELGRALLAVGDARAARQLLAESRAEGVATVAGQEVDQMLLAIDRIEADGRSAHLGWVEAVAGWDSNLNSAPGLASVAVPAFGGSILAIDPAGARQAGAFAALRGGASGRLVLDPRWSVIGNVSGRVQHHGGSDSRFDWRQLDASTGISYRVARHEFVLAVHAGAYEIDGRLARRLAGAAAEWTYRFDGFRQLSTYAQAGRLEYPTQRIADSRRVVAGATYAHQSRAGVWSYGGAYAGREQEAHAHVPHLGHQLAGVRGGVHVPLADGVTATVGGGWEQRRFGGADPLFLEKRRDRQADVSLGLTWAVAPGWRVLPQWLSTRTRSTVPLARYTKRSFALTVRREF